MEALKAQVLGGDLSPATLRKLADLVEKAETMAAESKLLKVGNSVRAPRGDACVKAMVSDLDAAAGTVEVVYEDATEATVPSGACSALLDFEVAPPAPAKDSVEAAGECKARGSRLFQAKDYVAASGHYKAALGVLKRLYPLGVGALVEVNSNGALRVGTVSGVDDRAAKESEIPNFKGSYLGRFPLVSADFWTSDHLLERSRSVDAFSGTRARGTLMLKRT